MEELDNKFFEKYKRLDRLCADMYSCKNGVSEYINQMEINNLRGQFRVASWETDYKKLKHVRWVRNQIAHDTGSRQMSEKGDFDFICDFYDRIFDGQDPLTLLRKKSEIQVSKHPGNSQRPATTNPLQATPNSPKTNAKPILGLILLMASMAILSAIIVAFVIWFLQD